MATDPTEKIKAQVESKAAPGVFKRVFFRFIPVTKREAIDTSKCVSVGFINVGGVPAFLNEVIQIPDYNPSAAINPFFLPINDWERDASRYTISFNNTVMGEKRVIVIYKEIYLPDYERLANAKRKKK